MESAAKISFSAAQSLVKERRKRISTCVIFASCTTSLAVTLSISIVTEATITAAIESPVAVTWNHDLTPKA